MTDDAKPRTPEAERARAYRERKKTRDKALTRADGKPISVGELNALLRAAAAASAKQVDLEHLLVRVAAKQPGVYLKFLSSFIDRADVPNLAGLTITVQQLVMSDAKPVPGVLNSPIQAHVHPSLRLAVAGGRPVDVIEADEPEGGDA